MKKIFLGGTCNGSQWREKLIPLLKIDYFNPVVPDWTPECQAREDREREVDDWCLYVITPKMTGVYSIAEVVDDSNKRPNKTLFCVLLSDDNTTFESHQIKALNKTAKLIIANGARSFSTLEDVADFLNTYTIKS
jgi:hypothetical protein